MSENACKDDTIRRERSNRDCGITEDLGNGMTRRIEFEVGYDHRSFPEACGGGGHGQHGMGMAFLLTGPEGVVQWKVNMPWWTPRPLGPLGDLDLPENNHGYTTLINSWDLGHHWRTPTYDGEMKMDCCYLEGQTHCFYDGSGLNAGPILQEFLYHGPHAVWAALARYYSELNES